MPFLICANVKLPQPLVHMWDESQALSRAPAGSYQCLLSAPREPSYQHVAPSHKSQKYKTQKEKQTITNLQKIEIKNQSKISAPVEPSSYYVTPSCRPPSCHNFAFTLADYALSMTFTQSTSLFCQNCVDICSLKILS